MAQITRRACRVHGHGAAVGMAARQMADDRCVSLRLSVMPESFHLSGVPLAKNTESGGSKCAARARSDEQRQEQRQERGVPPRAADKSKKQKHKNVSNSSIRDAHHAYALHTLYQCLHPRSPLQAEGQPCCEGILARARKMGRGSHGRTRGCALHAEVRTAPDTPGLFC